MQIKKRDSLCNCYIMSFSNFIASTSTSRLNSLHRIYPVYQ